MFFFKKPYIVTLLLLLSFPAYAFDAVKHLTIGAQRKLHNAPFSGNQEWQTIQDANNGFGLVVAEVDYHKGTGSTITNVIMQCFGNISFFGGGLIDHALQTCVMASGTCTSFDTIWTKSVSSISVGSASRWVWRIDAQGYDNIRCIMIPSGGVSPNDLISIHTKITAF